MLGQRRTTLDIADTIRSGRVLLVNSARAQTGPEVSSIVGGAILNLLNHHRQAAELGSEPARAQAHRGHRGRDAGVPRCALRRDALGASEVRGQPADGDAEPGQAERDERRAGIWGRRYWRIREASSAFQVNASDAELAAPGAGERRDRGERHRGAAAAPLLRQAHAGEWERSLLDGGAASNAGKQGHRRTSSAARRTPTPGARRMWTRRTPPTCRASTGSISVILTTMTMTILTTQTDRRD